MTTTKLAWTFPIIEERSSDRFLVALPAFLIVDDRKHSAQVVDLSSGGAMIETEARVTIGFPILLHCGSVVVRGVPIWKDGQKLGLKFDNPVSDRDVWEQHARSRAIATLREKAAR